MLGNETDARFIRDWVLEQEGYGPRDWTSEAPEGWTRLGWGAYRVAMLSPEGVVYKVEHRYGQFGQTNSHEAYMLGRYGTQQLPEGCRLPRWNFFPLDGKGVIVMEKFDKLLKDFSMYSLAGRKYWNNHRDLVDAMYETYDLHGSNIGVDEQAKLIVPIDLGG